jgi:hypothetical protein
LQTSDATGAARSQLGPDAQATVVYLNKRARPGDPGDEPPGGAGIEDADREPQGPGGNRTAAGGQAQVVTSSVLQTCRNRAVDAFTFVGNAFCGVLGTLFAPSALDGAK